MVSVERGGSRVFLPTVLLPACWQAAKPEPGGIRGYQILSWSQGVVYRLFPSSDRGLLTISGVSFCLGWKCCRAHSEGAQRFRTELEEESVV